MRRRTLLGSIGAAGAGVGGLLGTDVFSRATAQRDATETDTGALAPSFTDDRGTENGGGVPVNSTYS